jgi:transposase-like protein
MEAEKINKKSKDAHSKAPFKRRKASEMAIIIREVQSGYISKRGVCFKYGLNRNTLKKWMVRLSVSNLAEGMSQEILAAMPEEKQIIALQKKIKELSKALDAAHLKIEGLETMITIAEEELRIKIRKKSGTKQSRGSGKATRE